MRRIITTYLVLVAAVCQPAHADDSAQALTRSQTFTVQSTFADGKADIGNGVLIRRDGNVLTIVTAAHIVLEPGTLQIIDVTRRALYQTLSVRVLIDYDLALVRVRARPELRVAPVAFATPRPDEPVWVWGNHDSGFWNYATGVVHDTAAHIPGYFGSPRVTISCNECAPGDSGAGVFDPNGALIGIVTKGWKSVANGPFVLVEVEPSTLIAQEAAIVDGNTILAVSAKTP